MHHGVWRATDRHGRRWMVFEYDGLKRDGYFANVYEARAAGWLAWMQREGIS